MRRVYIFVENWKLKKGNKLFGRTEIPFLFLKLQPEVL